MSNFASRVIQMREAKGWKPEELAEKAGMSLEAIEYIESGRVGIGRRYPELAAVLGVSVEWLATGKEIDVQSMTEASVAAKGKELPSTNSLASRLIKTLTDKGIKPVELASRLNMNPSNISQLIRGRSTRSRRIDDIARELGVSTRWLETGKEDEASVAFEKRAIEQRLLNAIKPLPIAQIEHLVGIAEGLAQAQKIERVKITYDEVLPAHPLLQSGNAAVKERRPTIRQSIKKAS
jgi:transcriptional regulator with XRE-family HTH domain